jgi:hypothetical protein
MQATSQRAALEATGLHSLFVTGRVAEIHTASHSAINLLLVEIYNKLF